MSSTDSSLGSLAGLGGYVSSSGTRMSVRPQTFDSVRRSSSSIYSSSSLGYPSIDSTGISDNEFSQTDSEDGYP